MDNGLTQAQAAEMITHMAFYVGGRTPSRPYRSQRKFSRNASG